MKSTIRHEKNLGAQIERKAIRGILTRMVSKGRLEESTADVIRIEIDKSVARASKRKGGLGRK